MFVQSRPGLAEIGIPARSIIMSTLRQKYVLAKKMEVKSHEAMRTFETPCGFKT